MEERMLNMQLDGGLVVALENVANCHSREVVRNLWGVFGVVSKMNAEEVTAAFQCLTTLIDQNGLEDNIVALRLVRIYALQNVGDTLWGGRSDG